MGNYKIKLGKEGEVVAKGFLLKKGYVFLAENYRYKRSEVDLIFKDGNDIVFVEVKTRSSVENIDFNTIVSLAQQNKIKYGASAFLDTFLFDFNEVRFDLLIVSSNGVPVDYILNAF